MLKTAVLAAALLCALTVNSHARQRPHVSACVETGSTLQPSCMGQQSPFSGAVSIRVTMHKVRRSANPRPRLARETVSYEGRPVGCPHAWCGCWLASHRGISDRSLWLARNWAAVGYPLSGPQVGAIAVWRHHVGEIKAVEGDHILLLSGNDGRAVRERWRTTRGIIAYRRVGL